MRFLSIHLTLYITESKMITNLFFGQVKLSLYVTIVKLEKLGMKINSFCFLFLGHTQKALILNTSKIVEVTNLVIF